MNHIMLSILLLMGTTRLVETGSLKCFSKYHEFKRSSTLVEEVFLHQVFRHACLERDTALVLTQFILAQEMPSTHELSISSANANRSCAIQA